MRSIMRKKKNQRTIKSSIYVGMLSLAFAPPYEAPRASIAARLLLCRRLLLSRIDYRMRYDVRQDIERIR